MNRIDMSMLMALIGTTALTLSTLLGGTAGMGRVSVQGGPSSATPEGQPSCTADLGIVRSAKTCINVVHASQEAPHVDVLIDGRVAVSDLGFGAASEFVSFPAGRFAIVVAPTGAALDSALVEIPAIEFVAGRAYEIVVLGSLATLEAKVIDVDVYAVEGTSQAGSTRIRLVNASVDLVAANFDLIADDIATRLFRDVAIGQASDYAVVSAGRYTARLSDSAQVTEVGFSSAFSVAFERDTVTSIYVIGARSTDTLTILPVSTLASRLPAPATPDASPTA